MHDPSIAPLHTLRDLFDRLRAHGDRPALAHIRSGGLRVWSSADLCEKALSVAAGLAHMGIGRGDIVALIAANSPAYAAILLGAVLCGATAMPLDPQHNLAELQRIMDESGCRVAFLGPALAPALASTGTARHFIIDETAGIPSGWASPSTARSTTLPPIEATDVALLVYTSGTTGRPKPVPLTHENINACINGLITKGLMDPGDCALVPLPLHHVYPLVVGVLSPLAAGAWVIFPESLTGPDLRRALQRSGATHLIGVPSLYRSALQALTSIARTHPAGAIFLAALGLAKWLTRRTGWPAGRILFYWLRRRFAPRLKFLISGGAALDPELHRNLQALGWAVLTGYGLTETGPILAFSRKDTARVGTVGRPLDGVTLRISAPDAQGIGEIEAKGLNIFSGYRGYPAVTKAAFTDDGWFRTGDLGVIDHDGELRIVARKSEVIVLPDGKKIDPELVESAYQETPIIRELGIFMSDGILLAVIVPDLAKMPASGHTQTHETLQRTIAEIGGTLPSYQRLGGFVVSREPLPRTPVGKIRRHLLNDLYQRLREGRHVAVPSPLSPEDQALLREPIARQLWTWLQARFPGRTITLDSSPQLDLGIDSLGWIGLTLEIQRAVGIAIDEASIAGVTNIRDLLLAAIASGTRQPASEAGAARETRQAIFPSWAVRILRGLLIDFNRAMMRLVFSIRAVGNENLPSEGPYLICPNHTSFLDPLALAAALPAGIRRNLCWAGWVGILFNTPLRRFLSRIMGVLPIDPAQPARSLALVTSAIKAGRIVVWFPEGARSLDGTLQPFAAGTGHLIKESPVPVVPVFIAGAYEAWPVRKRWPRPNALSITFGKPISPAELGIPASDEQEIANRLRDGVATLASDRSRPA